MSERAKGKQGFASMDPDKLSRIASMGGRATQGKGNGPRYNPYTGKMVVRKGGKARGR